MRIILPIVASFCVLAGCSDRDPQSALEVQAVAQVLQGAYGRPDSPLSVEPVVVREDYAIAGWVQGALGGRALLSKQGGAWSIILCAGDAVREASYLAQTGMPSETATALAKALAAAEGRLPAERRAMFSRFGATVFMNQAGAGHPPADHDSAEPGTVAEEGHEQ